jgi:GNAT superfamily N-acetyltransferase
MKQPIETAVIENLLQSQYPNQCTKTAPFAFWKMWALIQEGEAFYLPKHDCYYLTRQKHLLYYYSPDGLCHIPADELNTLDAVSLPISIFEQVKDQLHGFEIHDGWSLRYDNNYSPDIQASPSYSALNFNFEDETHYRLAANIISGDESGQSTWMTSNGIHRMAKFPAFDPALWFFVYDNALKKSVAVSISAYTPEVRETDLDWIFVLPAYHGKGAGRFLINETIRRCRPKSDIIRVGGTVEFYRKCGFTDDTLWIWATKPGYDFTADSIQP